MNENAEPTRYTADVVAIRGDEVLLIERKRPPFQGKLALPGGHVNPGEPSRAAAARELEEETEVPVNAEDLIFLGTWDAPGRDPRGPYSTDAYMVRLAAGTSATAADDAADVQWVPLDAPGEVAFDHAEILHAALTNN